MIEILRIIIYTLLQCTWGILQTGLGLLLFLKHSTSPHSHYHGSIRTAWPRSGGVSLGLFIFVNEKVVNRPKLDLSSHEFGHTIQSLILGPLYLPVIGIPSLLWFKYYQKYVKVKALSYDDFWVEKWADKLGKHYTAKALRH